MVNQAGALPEHLAAVLDQQALHLQVVLEQRVLHAARTPTVIRMQSDPAGLRTAAQVIGLPM